jgi:DNA-binding NarL/FixJ family response regulator
MASISHKPNLAKLRVLIAGNRDLQVLLAGVLQEMGISDIVRTLDGQAAMNHLARVSGRVDLVICRLDLPKEDGLEVLKYLREYHGNQPFLLLAATVTGETIAAAQSLRVNGFLAIPFRADILKNRIMAIMSDWLIPDEPSNEPARTPNADEEEPAEDDNWLI